VTALVICKKDKEPDGLRVYQSKSELQMSR